MRPLLIISLVLLFKVANAQHSGNKYLAIADSLYSKRYYQESINYYLNAKESFHKDSAKSCIITHKLSDAFSFTNQDQNAQIYLTNFIKNCNSSDDDLLQLAKILIPLGNYEKASKILAIYDSRVNNSVDAIRLMASCDSAILWQNYNDYLIINEDKINTSTDELSPQLINNKLYFSSLKSLFNNDVNHSKYAIYSVIKTNEQLKKCSKINFESGINPSLINFNVDQTEIYATSLNAENQQLELHRATISEGKINKFEAFLYNNDSCSFAQASLSPTGSVIYFVSDMKGGYGGTDIYFCERKNGKWSKPQNMGNEINTAGNELFPYLYDGHTLYFSSNGKVGMGGYDLFKANIKNIQSITIENLKFPLNSPKDELNIFFETSQNGYISSNRKQGKGGYDIYSFKKR